MDNLEAFLAESEAEFLSFGDVARELLNMQAQYASYFLRGAGDFPRIADDLRIKGDAANYHSLEIHRDDVGEFVARAKAEHTSWGMK